MTGEMMKIPDDDGPMSADQMDIDVPTVLKTDREPSEELEYVSDHDYTATVSGIVYCAYSLTSMADLLNFTVVYSRYKYQETSE